MGVRGLTTYIISKGDTFLCDYKLHNTKLIIDGSSLFYFLYQFYDISYQFGGDYDHFARKCKEFFGILHQCDVTPIVVFDGADDPNDIKLETHFYRLNKRYEEIERIFKQFKRMDSVENPEEDKRFVLPLLSKLTFRQVLVELGIVHVACMFEADSEIAVLANHFKCPVLSNDSDFYVFNLENGYISLGSLPESLKTGRSMSYIPVKLYNCNRLIEKFNMKADEYILPVFATLQGNDHFDSTKIEIPSPRDENDKSTDLNRKLECGKANPQNIVDWIRTAAFKTGWDAYIYISEVISKKYSNEKKTHFQASVSVYTAIKSEACRTMYQRERHELSDVKEIIKTRCKTTKDFNGRELPTWFIESLINCDIDCSFLLNIAVNRRVMFKAQVENLEKPPSFACSKGMRRIVWGILVGPVSCQKPNRKTRMQEYYRLKDNCSNVKPIYSLPGSLELPSLQDDIPSLPSSLELPSLQDDIPSLSQSRKETLLLAAFGDMAQGFSEEEDETSKILILMLSLWKRNSCATGVHLRGFIISILAMHILNPVGTSLCTDIVNASEALGRHEKDDFKKRMEVYFNWPKDLTKGRINKDLLHKNAQFQAIFQHTCFLNQLLFCPFSFPNAEHILNGTFIYNVCTSLEDNKQPKTILGVEESALYRLFDKWVKEVEMRCEVCERSRCPVASTVINFIKDPNNRFVTITKKIKNAS